MKNFIFIWMITLVFFGFADGQTAKIKTADLQMLTGAQWIGNLTYLDYGKNTRVSIPSNLTVLQSKDKKSAWIFEYQYPDEPKANSKDMVEISADRKIFDGETVVERTNLSDKTVKIITRKNGNDNDKKAVFRFTYLLGKNNFSIKKEVQYEGANEFFVRSEYVWKR